MSELLTLPEAAHLVGLPLDTLVALTRAGRLRVVTFRGETLLSRNQARQARRLSEERRPPPMVERGQFAHLAGKPIRLMEAVRQYGLAHANLLYWAKRGYVSVLAREPQAVWLNEADVAYAAALARANGGMRQGRRVFPRSPA